jgi:peptidoglycan glycosyltransferase
VNAPLRRVAVACLLLFGALLVNANWLQVVKANAYQNDPRNARVLIKQYERERGPIVVAGQAVAQSTPTNDSLKYLRSYPGGPAYAPVTGFYSLVYGATGIEKSQDAVLAGTDARLFVRRVSDLVTGRTPQGGSVVLTLNPAAQAAAFDGLSGKRGAVVALDPTTGAILALASSPSYDPSTLSTHTPRDIQAAYQQLNQAPDAPMLDRALRATYPPGSTFKLVTTAAALGSGKVQPDTVLDAPDQLTLPQTKTTLSNFGGESCGAGGKITLTQALVISCNTAFAKLGGDLGDGALRDQARKFGFGTDVEVPLAAARSIFPDLVNLPQTYLSAIGQYDVRMTPLQGAMIAAAIANHGKLMRPYLVQEVQAPDLSVLTEAEPKVLGQAVTGDVADQLTAMMVRVVDNGTAQAAQLPGVKVAGKTGTAQHAEGAAPHAWFVAFAPAQAPKVAVAVVVEDGGNLGNEATGGALAAPIARSVLQAVLGGR